MLYRFGKVCLDYRINQRTLRILSNLSLEVNEGDFLALMGPSGLGKTTILNIMAGFLKPTAGQVFYLDSDLYGLSSASIARYRNREIGMVHQFFNLISDFTALQNVMTPLLIGGGTLKDSARRAEEILERVGILSRAKHYPAELSGGEQQRAAIARALVNRPKVILADEPTGNLDQGTSREIMDLLGAIHQGGNTFVIVTHDPMVAERATRVIDLTSYLSAS